MDEGMNVGAHWDNRSLFARVVLERGGAVEVILPAVDYRDRKIKPDNLVEFDDLISRARVVRTPAI
jgi:hypothetical protein